MKKVIFILGFILLVSSISCFSDIVEKNRKEFKSKTKSVYKVGTLPISLSCN
jgi:hypothetical protein